MQDNVILIAKLVLVLAISFLIFKLNSTESKKTNKSKRLTNIRYCFYCLIVIIACTIKRYFPDFNRFVFIILFVSSAIINELELRLEMVPLEGEFHNLVKSFGMIIFKLALFMLILVMVGIIVFSF